MANNIDKKVKERLMYIELMDESLEKVAAQYKHKTTRVHYEKYRDKAKELGIAITNLGLFGLKDKRQLMVKYILDQHLNSIPLIQFDSLAYAYKAYNPHVYVSISELVCTYKHLLIYDVLGIEPEFED